MSPRSALRNWPVALALTIVLCAPPTRATAGPMIITSSTPQNIFFGSMPSGGSITVSGYADGSNFYGPGQPYLGEGYVVGPKNGSGQVQPYNLTAYNGLPYLINNSFGGSNQITATFSFKIYSVSFDYEIFPNGQMPNGSGVNPANRGTTAGWPDFTFKADGQTVFRTLATMPGEPGYSSSFLSSQNTEIELAPQFVGSSGTIYFANGVNTLEFIDWPPTIGVGNVQFGPAAADPVVTTPEPASVVTWAVCLGALGGIAVRLSRRRALVAAV